MQYLVGTYRGCDYTNVQEAIDQDAIYLYETWVDEDAVADVMDAMAIGIIASGREDEMSYCLKNNDGAYVDIPAIGWDGDVEALFEPKGVNKLPITEMSGGLTIGGNVDVLIDLVKSLRSEYDSNGSDMPKTLNDVVFQLECRLGLHDEPKEQEEGVYAVYVIRSSYASRNIIVNASSEKEAEEKAYEIAGDFDYSDHNVEYEVDGVSKM